MESYLRGYTNKLITNIKLVGRIESCSCSLFSAYEQTTFDNLNLKVKKKQ